MKRPVKKLTPDEIICPECQARPLSPCKTFVRRSTLTGLDEGKMEEIPEVHKARKREAALITMRHNQMKVEHPNFTPPPRSYA